MHALGQGRNDDTLYSRDMILVDILSSDAFKNGISIITLILAYFGGYAAAKINRKNKIADVVMHCINRYDAISRDRGMITTEDQAYGYFRRYFGLKSDQFDYWLSGLVDAENISSWFYSILNSFEQEKHVQYIENGVMRNITFEEGWHISKSSHDAPNAAFVRVVERIRELAKTNIDRKEKYYYLIELLRATEAAEQDFILFADISFMLRRLRGGDMYAFQRMEVRHHKRVAKISGADLHLPSA